MPIVGTAGHVDHGKSTLVMALTGRDPDRLAEEKARGLTIDLGFAWTTLPTGTEIGFVDVPGHEKFIKNMLAGIEAVNVALLVVAADEGWMPQSEEHLAVIDLLQVPEVVVALTKMDRVDPDTLELAQLEIEERLAGTVGENAPIIPVDSISGTGVESIIAALDDSVGKVPVPNGDRPRMWVDRSFTIAGAGTVVTGTMLDGSLEVGETVALYPEQVTARVRAIQSHETDVERLGPGNRAALNLAGIEREVPARGSMIGLPGQWDVTRRLLVSVAGARGEEELQDRGAYHLHLGSGSWPARVRTLADGSAALLTVPSDLPAAVGDRFILRDVGRRAVIAGGRILDPAPPSRISDVHCRQMATSVDLGPDARAAALLALRGSDRADRIGTHSGGGIAEAAISVGDWIIEPSMAEDLAAAALDRVNAFHESNPLRTGIPLAELAAQIGLPAEIAGAIVARSNSMQIDGGVVARRGFASAMSGKEQEAWRAAEEELRAGLTVPTVGSIGLETEQLNALVRDGRLVRVSRDLVYLPEQIEQLSQIVNSFGEPFTVADFRDRAGVTRKYAVPLLEFFDSTGVTVRDGDLRRLREQ